MNRILFPVTKNCDLWCKHCYLSAGPGREDSIVSQENFEKMINNLPFGDIAIDISGGEIATQMEELDGFLNFLQGKKQDGSFSNLEYTISSNGNWAKSIEEAKDMLSYLESKGVTDLFITSNDTYHLDCGLKREYIRNIKEVSKLEVFEKFVLEIYGGYDFFFNRKPHKDFPIGRAKAFNVPNGDLRLHDDRLYCRDSFGKDDEYSLSADASGNLYTCCYQGFKLNGNLIEEPLVDIFERSYENKELMTIVTEGVVALAVKKGISLDVAKSIKRGQGECGLCYRAFIDKNEGIEKLSNIKVEDLWN